MPNENWKSNPQKWKKIPKSSNSDQITFIFQHIYLALLSKAGVLSPFLTFNTTCCAVSEPVALYLNLLRGIWTCCAVSEPVARYLNLLRGIWTCIWTCRKVCLCDQMQNCSVADLFRSKKQFRQKNIYLILSVTRCLNQVRNGIKFFFLKIN